jgi:hypothetical protein
MKNSVCIVMVAVAAIALMVCTVRTGQSAGCTATHGRFAQGLDDFEWRKDCRVMTLSMDITGSAAVFRANGEIVKESTLDVPISVFRETSFGIYYPAQYPDRMKITNVTIETK